MHKPVFSSKLVFGSTIPQSSDNLILQRPYGTVVNTYAAQSGGCRFESLWGFGFSLKGAYYEVGYSGKKTFLAGLQCTLTSSCTKMCRNQHPRRLQNN